MFLAAIPSPEKCLELMEHHQMPRHIQRHSFKVAGLASFLGRLLVQEGRELDLKLIYAGSLLHDLGKARSIQSGEDHGQLGAAFLEEDGFFVVADIVREHATMDSQRALGTISESLLVNYADKRVRHDKVVTLDDRFLDLVNRYARAPHHRISIWSKLSLYRQIEERIFQNLTIGPESREIMTVECLPLFNP